MKQRFRKKAAYVVSLVVLIMMLSSCAANQNASLSTAEESTTAPITTSPSSTTASTSTPSEPYYFEDFDLTMLDGTKTSLHAYEGQMIILNFWATWCTYCVQEMPLLDELDKREDVTVLAVSVGEDMETVKAYIDKNGYDFDVFLDEEGTLAGRFGVRGFPTSIFIGHDFEYFYSYPGMVEKETIDAIFEAIDGILEERENQ